MIKFSNIQNDNIKEFLNEKAKKVNLLKCVDGCFLDNYLYLTENGLYIGVFENYLNYNNVCYDVFFSFSEDENKELLEQFEELEND